MCNKCDGLVEDGRSRTCYGCYLDGLIPDPVGYMRRECYVFAAGLPAGGQATKHPPTGHAMLDSTPMRASERDVPRGAQPPW